MSERKHPLAICEKCPFKNRSVAYTTGPEDAKIAVVSRSPGHYEALAGKSFSGPSGRVLDHLLQIHGYQRGDILTTNVVLCQSDGTEQGWGVAAACCEPRLASEIETADTVIACGKEAVYAVLGESNISQNRGYPHVREIHASDQTSLKQRVIVTTNPAVVLRDDANYPEMVRDFRLALDPLPAPKLPTVRIIDNIREARDAIVDMLELITTGTKEIVASDLETRWQTGETEIVCAAFATRAERAVVFGEGVCSNKHFVTHELSQLWMIPGVKYLWHNGKYDIKVLRSSYGIPATVGEDSMLLSWALDERPGDPESGAGGHSLEWLLKDELGWPKYEPTSVRNFKRTGNLEKPRELYEYNGFDTAGSLALFEVLKHRAINDNVWEKPYKGIISRLSMALARIELVGNLYDAEKACDILEYEVWPKLDDQRQRLRRISSRPTLNPNSPKQLEKLMYDDWGIEHDLMRPKIERQGKRSTDKYVREAMLLGLYRLPAANGNRDSIDQFIQTLDDFKELDTQRSRYLEGLVLKRKADGRIYTEFKIHGTESGRLSSANPNLQNITRTKEGLPNIRSCFIPDPGCVFVSADLSQAELRTIAVLSGDINLRSIYLDTNRSLHKEVAAEFYGENYTYEQYVRAKNINFGVAYWQSAFSFAQLYHMPREEAQKFIDFWWDRFPQVWAWTKETEKAVLTTGELQSPFGHKRRFFVIPADESSRLHIIKEGINFKPQNIAANITLWALCDFVDHLIKYDMWHIAQPRITVHDSILVNVRMGHEEEIGYLLKGFLEDAPMKAIGWDFPYLADLSIGPTWGELREINFETNQAI
jgi:uracil-DNA glycosylase family 4